MNKIDSLSDSDFLEAVSKSACYSDVLRFFGLSTTSSSYIRYVKNRMLKMNCSFGVVMTHRGGSKSTRSLSEILVTDSDYDNTKYLKKRLVDNGILEYKCYVCGNDGCWNGKKLVLVLDHINGVKTDNRIENLRLLCPNCDSQTDTFKGKNKKYFQKDCDISTIDTNFSGYELDKIEYFCKDCGKKICRGAIRCVNCYRKIISDVSRRPEKDILLKLVKSNSFENVGRMFNVSGNTIKKWLKHYDLPTLRNDIDNMPL